jgi:two-component system, response regulator
MNPKKIHVLLVEDNPDHAELLRRNFESLEQPLGFHQVEDGETALDYIFARKKFADRGQFPNPDLVMLDLRLPRLDGTEVLQQVKNHPDTRHIPIVVLTTSDAEHDLDTAIRLRADRFLTKPAAAHTLAKLLVEFHLLDGVPQKNSALNPPAARV